MINLVCRDLFAHLQPVFGTFILDSLLEAFCSLGQAALLVLVHLVVLRQSVACLLELLVFLAELTRFIFDQHDSLLETDDLPSEVGRLLVDFYTALNCHDVILQMFPARRHIHRLQRCRHHFSVVFFDRVKTLFDDGA